MGHTGVDKDEERSMNMDGDSFPARELISWFSQTVYSPVISAANTCYNAEDQCHPGPIDYITRFALGRENGKDLCLSLSLFLRLKEKQVK